MGFDARERSRRRPQRADLPLGKNHKTLSETTMRSVRRRKKNAVRMVELSAPVGRVAANPALEIFFKVRRASYALPNCTVYDAAGKPIAIIDGVTRERRPL